MVHYCGDANLLARRCIAFLRDLAGLRPEITVSPGNYRLAWFLL
jgi:hypothetical protein